MAWNILKNKVSVPLPIKESNKLCPVLTFHTLSIPSRNGWMLAVTQLLTLTTERWLDTLRKDKGIRRWLANIAIWSKETKVVWSYPSNRITFPQLTVMTKYSLTTPVWDHLGLIHKHGDTYLGLFIFLWLTHFHSWMIFTSWLVKNSNVK